MIHEKSPGKRGFFLWAISGGLPDFWPGVGLYQCFHGFLTASATRSGTEGFRQRHAAGVAVFDGVKDLAIGNALANTNVHGDGVEKGC